MCIWTLQIFVILNNPFKFLKKGPISIGSFYLKYNGCIMEGLPKLWACSLIPLVAKSPYPSCLWIVTLDVA